LTAGAAPTPEPEVRIEGDGVEPIVMVHGWPDTLRLWDRQVEAFGPRYRCIRLTLPGFAAGATRRAFALDEVIEAIRGVVEQAGAPVTLLLHDWGCFFGYQFAMRHPQLVRRVIGVDVGDAGSRRHLAETGLLQKLAIVAYQLWLAVAWRIGGRIGDRMARRMAAWAGAPAGQASIHAQMGHPYAAQWLGAGGGYRRLKAFRPHCPMLFAYGRRKPFMFHSSGWIEEIAAKPGSRVQAFDCGHWVMIDRADEFNRAVLDWLLEGDPSP
jgi:pimeloyl-ACP methyl ester carboxylesterase